MQDTGERSSALRWMDNVDMQSSIVGQRRGQRAWATALPKTLPVGVINMSLLAMIAIMRWPCS